MNLGVQYANAIAESRGTTWSSWRARFEGGELTPIESLVLIHPKWYSGPADDFCQVRGKRRFEGISSSGSTCASKRLWGYDCPFTASQLQLDHWFPWSFGGPTAQSNGAWLCAEHNLAKGADWHLTIAEPSNYEWFPQRLDVVFSILGR